MKYGHSAGDEVIINVVGVIKKRIGQTDIIGRYGGEEFAVALPETNIKDALVLADDIRKRIADTCITLNGTVVKITASIGVSTYEPGGKEITVEMLIDQALLNLNLIDNDCQYFLKESAATPRYGRSSSLR